MFECYAELVGPKYGWEIVDDCINDAMNPFISGSCTYDADYAAACLAELAMASSSITVVTNANLLRRSDIGWGT